MTLAKIIRPFRALRPQTNSAADVIAPPYDVVSSAEARQLAVNKPHSFLHISKAEIDLAENVDPYSDQVYQQAALNFQTLQQQGILKQDDKACYYIYRLTQSSHQQTGLVATISVDAYRNQQVRKHEQTLPTKVADRVKQISALNAQTGPVLLAYRSLKHLDELLIKPTEKQPVYDITADDGIRHQLWLVDDDFSIKQINELFSAVEAFYIADGHHRSEAAKEVADKTNDGLSQYFLTVIFPHDQLQILPYHRVVKDLGKLSQAEFLNKLKTFFTMSPANQAVMPVKRGQFGMYLDKQWYLLEFNGQDMVQHDPEKALDVAILSDFLLSPILNITDLRRDPRIDYVGGSRGLAELEKRVNSGSAVMAFSLFPTPIESVMQIADKHHFMPPKSTWFDPKLADGLFSYCL